MRIIAGRFRRRNLLTRSGLVTRPITDRVKETLFERLGEAVIDARVLDVFAGTGTLGLEALSREAASVVFVEKDRQAVDLLRKNVEKLAIEESVLCWQVDAQRSSFRPKNRDELLPYDLVFFDPPYRFVSYIQPGAPLYRSLERIARENVTSAEATLVFRAPIQAKFELPPVWVPEWDFRMSGMNLIRYRKSEGTTVA
jgi:16S rRNA (guanine966-N2)-methyltransferase